MKPSLSDNKLSDKKARRRLTAYRRLNLILGGGGAVVGGVLAYWYSQASVGTVDRFVCAVIAALQIVPILGLAFVLPGSPPASVGKRGLWMTWVMLAAVALLFGILAIALKYFPV